MIIRVHIAVTAKFIRQLKEPCLSVFVFVQMRVTNATVSLPIQATDIYNLHFSFAELGKAGVSFSVPPILTLKSLFSNNTNIWVNNFG